MPTLQVPVTTDGNSYEVRLQEQDVPAEYWDHGKVNLEVLAIGDGASIDSYSETLEPAEDAWERSALVEAQLAKHPDVARGAPGPGDMDAPGVLYLDEQTDTDGPVARRSVQRVVPAVATTGPMAQRSCPRKWFATDKTWKRKVKISDVMPGVAKMKGVANYYIGTDHTIEIGAKIGDSVAGGGSRTVSAGESVDPEMWKNDRIMYTSWEFRKYYHGCAKDYTQARAEKHLGGVRTESRDRPTYKKCRRYVPIKTWAQAKGTAYTYSLGWTLWGAGFDTQTGYDEKTELVYSFPKVARWLCGSNDYPAQANLVAGYRKNQA